MEWFLKMFRLVFIKGHGGLENKSMFAWNISSFYFKTLSNYSLLLYLGVVITQVKGELQIGQEVVWEFRIHVQNLQKIFSVDGVDVAVAQRSNICIGFPRFGVQMNHLSKNIILTWEVGVQWSEEKRGKRRWSNEGRKWTNRQEKVSSYISINFTGKKSQL